MDSQNKVRGGRTKTLQDGSELRARGGVGSRLANAGGGPMLKRWGAHFRPVPERHCRSRLTLEAAGGQAGSGATGGGSSTRLQLSAASFPTRAPSRETAALQHFARAGYRAHQTCQLCQEAIRARLRRESLRARQLALAPALASAPTLPPTSLHCSRLAKNISECSWPESII